MPAPARRVNLHLYAMPFPLQALFGVKTTPELTEVRLNLEVYRPHPYFPSLIAGLHTTGLDGGYAVSMSHKSSRYPAPICCFKRLLRPHRPAGAAPVCSFADRAEERDVYRATWQRLCACMPHSPCLSMLVAHQPALHRISQRPALQRRAGEPGEPRHLLPVLGKRPVMRMGAWRCGRGTKRSRQPNSSIRGIGYLPPSKSCVRDHARMDDGRV